MQNEAHRRIDDAVERAREAGVAARGEVITGVAFERILDFAKRNAADVIVMGTHGREGLPRFFMGSVAEMVLRKSSCPVLIVREGIES
jgi:nucleotide-binding universal stress UspA family protein